LEEVVMKVLAGDIGGTNARLAVYEIELTRYKTLGSQRRSPAASTRPSKASSQVS
jgi:glucokinase